MNAYGAYPIDLFTGPFREGGQKGYLPWGPDYRGGQTMIEIKNEYLYVGGGTRGNVGGLVHERSMRTIDLFWSCACVIKSIS